jgi:4'-phosphopantetheinyl transferase
VPLLLSKPISPYSSYAVWNIKETNAQLIDLHNNSYPKDLHPTKLAEWLVTQILLQNVCQQFNIAYRGIKKNDAGKPFLIDSTAQISISHSFPMASVMINQHKVCGVDLERQRSALLKIQHKFLHKEEFQYIDDINKLCAIWCAKEVLYKIHGRKQLSLKDDLKVIFISENRLTGYILKGEFEQSFIIHYEPLKDFFLAYSI